MVSVRFQCGFSGGSRSLVSVPVSHLWFQPVVSASVSGWFQRRFQGRLQLEVAEGSRKIRLEKVTLLATVQARGCDRLNV